MRKGFTELETDISTILKDVSALNLEITRNAEDSEMVRNLSSGINNSLSTIADLFSAKLKEIEKGGVKK